ncbi:MAG TPA: hypothetical protein VGA26_03025 [Candidatus Limnocylindria bacterium]
MTSRPSRRTPPRWQLALLVVAVAALTGFTTVRTNALGAADRLDRVIDRVALFMDPPPDRPTLETVVVTPRPSATAAAIPAAIAGGAGLVAPDEIPSRGPVATPTPAPVRQAVDVRIVDDHDAVFTSQVTTEDCAVAATQMILTILGLGNPSHEFQLEIGRRIGEWESSYDSHNGGWGPAAVSLALEAYGAPGYKVWAYASYTDALRDAAIALSTTGKPVALFPWWGAHTWVMTGYQADADPTVFADATVTGLYILDPWYPRVSSIWGASDPPGNFEDLAEMRRNWPVGTARDGWTRPGGVYPDRDGRFVVLLPTTPIASGGSDIGS